MMQMDKVGEREFARAGIAGLLVLALFMLQIALKKGYSDVWNTHAAWAILLAPLSIAALMLVETRRSATNLGQYGFLAWYVVAGVVAASIIASEWPGTGARLLAGLGRVTFISVVVAFAVAVSEEIFFRKWLTGWLAQTMPTWSAILVSAVGFQLAHFSPLPGLFLGAVVYGYVAARYQSIVATVVMHCLFDTIGFLAKSLPGGGIPAPSELPGDAFLVEAANNTGKFLFTAGVLAFIVVAKIAAWAMRWRQVRSGAGQ
jgi:membrane protease YdiL (CAAX protease family)